MSLSSQNFVYFCWHCFFVYVSGTHLKYLTANDVRLNKHCICLWFDIAAYLCHCPMTVETFLSRVNMQNTILFFQLYPSSQCQYFF